MKPLVFLNGPMGVGKSTVAALLQRKFDRCAYLDGDWCYRVHPFRVTKESKALVLNNIAFLLDGYLKSPDVDLVLFTWVMNLRDLDRLGRGAYKALCKGHRGRASHAGGLASGALLSARL